MTEGDGGMDSGLERSIGELMVARQGSLLVLQGPKDAIEQLTASEPVLHERSASAVTRAGGVGALASLMELVPRGAAGAQQQVFKLDSTAMQQLNSGQLKQATSGKLSMVARGPNGRYLKQGKLVPVDLNPTDVINVQMAMMTLALSAAINEVADAVARVEEKVDRLADLVDAERVGSILGAHHALVRRAETAGPDGSLADADWHAIDGVGIQVEQQIEALRSFARKRLAAAEGEGTGVTDRRDGLINVADLSETLRLLVVAQDSLFLFQQLRLSRIRDTEPERLEGAVREATALLEGHEAEDADLLGMVRQVVADRALVRMREIHRFTTTSKLAETAASIDQNLGWFAGQRTLAYEPIAEVEIPGVGDAVDEVRSRGATVVVGGRRMAGGLVGRVRSIGEDAPALDPGDEDLLLPASAGVEADASIGGAAEEGAPDAGQDGVRSRLGKARRSGADRFRRRSGYEQDQDDPTDD